MFQAKPARRLALLGSTGSIGGSVLRVVEEFPDRFAVVALTAGKNLERLAAQTARFRPEAVAIADAGREGELRAAFRAAGVGAEPVIFSGPAALETLATALEYEQIILATVGVAALPASFAAARRGKSLALANKEILVAAGELLMEAARAGGAEILPIDSEHSAIHQCLRAGRREELARVLLTASGGPLRDVPLEDLERVTPARALAHPTWRMGARVTLDSATLMNKGFEVIEARRLFSLAASEVEVLIHRQSVAHSLVEFRDGSVMAQLGEADMRIPIQYALTYPDRWPTRRPGLDLAALARLEFAAPDAARYPCLGLARAAAEAGGAAPAVLNAADEVAVAAFAAEAIAFPAIAAVVAQTLEELSGMPAASLDDVLAADAAARRRAEAVVARGRVVVA